MGYEERAVPGPAKQTIAIDGKVYDLDRFGMDDGKSDEPDEAFRFLFQLGYVYLIHLYVIQAGGQAAARRGAFFHTFWLRDCAVYEVEPEEYGPPKEVHCGPLELPLVYSTVAIGDRTFELLSLRFAAPSAQELKMTFELSGGCRLWWTRARAWELEEAGTRRPLAATERLAFG